jgi:hypothetical protein
MSADPKSLTKAVMRAFSQVESTSGVRRVAWRAFWEVRKRTGSSSESGKR